MSPQTEQEDLKHYFGKFGELMDCFVPRDRNTGASRGFGFVTFVDKRDAEEAEKETHDR